MKNKKNAQNAKKAATKNLISKEINKKLHVEKKQNTIVSGPATIDNTNGVVFQVISPVAGATGALQQGPQRNQRIGDKIYIHHIDIVLSIETTLNAAACNDSSVRIVLLQDKEAQGVILSLTELFTDPGAETTAISSFSIYNVPSRYRIMYDKLLRWDSGSSGPSSAANNLHTVRIRKSFKNPLVCDFYNNTTSAGIAAIDRGAISLYVVNNSPNANACNVRKCYRSIIYTDA